jgi:hypothetical protein
MLEMVWIYSETSSVDVREKESFWEFFLLFASNPNKVSILNPWAT